MKKKLRMMRALPFQINDDEVPDDGKNDDDASETKKESSQRYVKKREWYVKKREEDVVDYISAGERVGREMRYVAETSEGERIGDWSPSPTGMRTTRLHKYSGTPPFPINFLSFLRSTCLYIDRLDGLHPAVYSAYRNAKKLTVNKLMIFSSWLYLQETENYVFNKKKMIKVSLFRLWI